MARTGGPRLVAYDKATGKELASVDLPGAAIGTPMTYLVGGKQFVAITVQGRDADGRAGAGCAVTAVNATTKERSHHEGHEEPFLRRPVSNDRMLRFDARIAGRLLLTGCAARGPSPQVVAELGKAERPRSRGLLHLPERIAGDLRAAVCAANDQRREQLEGAFDATLLIAMREKELGIPAEGSLDRARQQAAKLGNSKEAVASAVSPAVLLEAAALVIGDTAGLDPEQRARLHRPPAAAARAEQSAAPRTRCLGRHRSGRPIRGAGDRLRAGRRCVESVKPADILAKYSGVPLIQFRLAVCGGIGAPQAGHSAKPIRAGPRHAAVGGQARAGIGSQTEAIDLYKGAALLGAGARGVSGVALDRDLLGAIEPVDRRNSSRRWRDSIRCWPTRRRIAMRCSAACTSLSYLMRHQEAIVTPRG